MRCHCFRPRGGVRIDARETAAIDELDALVRPRLSLPLCGPFQPPAPHFRSMRNWAVVASPASACSTHEHAAASKRRSESKRKSSTTSGRLVDRTMTSGVVSGQEDAAHARESGSSRPTAANGQAVVSRISVPSEVPAAGRLLGRQGDHASRGDGATLEIVGCRRRRGRKSPP